MANWWWIIAATFCMYRVLALPALPQDTPNEEQNTQWKDEQQMQRALKFHYPVILKPNESMPEVDVSIDGSTGHLRNTRQTIDDLAVLPTPQDYLLFANRQFLVTINRDGTGLQGLRLTHSSGGTPNAIAIDYDIRSDMMVWTDVLYSGVYVGYFNGTNITRVISTGITTPDGVAWDWCNKKLYWTDAGDKDIEVYDPVNQHRKKLIQKGTAALPRAIVLDPANGLMYWTDWGQPATIEKASMDGSSQVILHNTGLGWPNGLALDQATQTLYWADAQLDRIETSRTDGTGRRDLSIPHIYHPFGITFYQGLLYWTDWQLRAVLKVPLTQPSAVQIVISNLINDPMGMRVVSENQQPLCNNNPCSNNNGGCSHLCLLSSNSGGFTCACPDGSYLATNQRDCIGTQTSPTVTPPIDGALCTPDCQNGGTCTSPGVCTCVAGWRGVRCEEAICSPSCQNGGSCTEPGTCSCTAHWTGSTCNEAVCDEGFCMNGGTCARHNFCVCPDGWSGTRCDMPECDPTCQHGTCTGPNTCTCEHGWEGTHCERPICYPSCSHGTCTSPDYCACDSGWEGVLCDDAICEPACLNGGQCDAPNRCTCTAEYEGTICGEAVCFPPDGCLNGGECVRPSLCACRAEWTGLRCEEPICNPACVHGDCTDEMECACHTGWEGSRCNEAVCYPPSGCRNGGVCASPGICSCATGWTGARCDEGICTMGCFHGDCLQPEVCQCHSGWTGNRCDEALCFPECQNGGQCVAAGHCVCDHNFYGDRCEFTY